MLYALFLSQVAQSPNFPNNKSFVERTQAPTTSGQIPKHQLLREVDQSTIKINDSIENHHSIFDRYNQISKIAADSGFHSYVSPNTLFLDGCSQAATHPRGVPRERDGKLNGYSILYICGDYTLQMMASDYSFPTKPSSRMELPFSSFPIRGGSMSIRYSKSEAGRLRVDTSSIGRNLSVNMLIQSDHDFDINRARSIAISATEAFYANPPIIDNE